MDTLLCWRKPGWQARISLPRQYHRWHRLTDCESRIRASDGPDNGHAGRGGQPPQMLFQRLFRVLTREPGGVEQNQLFRRDFIFLSNSSKVCSPLSISPLMKNVGVELTFRTSPANF